VRLWDIAPQSWVNRACQIANRNLSQEEWRKYFGDKPHQKTCPELPKDTLGALKRIKEAKALAQEGKLDAAVDKFKEARELDARLVSDPETRTKQLFASVLVGEGKQLAFDGDIEGAVVKFEEAQALDLRLTFDPYNMAQHFAAQGLVEKGEQLAFDGEIEGAVVKFEEAQALDSRLTFEPETKAKNFFTLGLVEQRQYLAWQEKIEPAIANYQEAQQMDSRLEISAHSWNRLCWYGSLYGYAAQVIEACETAVEIESEDRDYRKSRGLARALTGDTQGAIEDFQFYVDELQSYVDENQDEEEYYIDGIRQVQDWIDTLEAGENPFTEEVLEGLR
jgi:hypothetical protein